MSDMSSTNNTYVPPTSTPAQSQQGPPVETNTFKMTDGWYVALACITGIAVANTRFGPVAFGVLTLALIYQLTLLIQGK